MLRASLVLLVTFFGLGASFFNPYYGLLLYNWYAHFSPLELTYGILSGSRLSLYAGLVFLLTTFFHQRRFFVNSLLTLFIILFLFHILITVAFQPEQNITGLLYSTEILIKSLIICLVTPVVILNKKHLQYYITAVALMISILAFYYGIFGLFAGSRSISGAGRVGDNNIYAAVLAGVWPLTLGLILAYRQWYLRLTFVAISLGTLIALLLTFSRGGFLSLVVIFFLLLFKIRVKFLLPLLLIIGVFGYYLYADNQFVSLHRYSFQRDFQTGNQVQETIGYFQARMATILEKPEDSASGKSRLHFWHVAWLMAQENPLFGVGLDHYQDRYSEYDFSDGLYGKSRAVHSLYFLLIGETGYLGFSIVFCIIALCFYYYYLGLKKLAVDSEQRGCYLLVGFLPIGLAGFLVASIFVNTLYAEILWFFVAAAMALKNLTLTNKHENTAN